MQACEERQSGWARFGPPGRALAGYLAAPGRRCFLGASTRLWLWNVLAATLLHLPYLDNVNTSGSVKAWLFLHLAMVSSAFGLSLVVALISTLLALLWPRGKGRSLGGVF
ncbi:MAG: hypothetical protein KDB61_11675, partial [Planctomycetes bacterium]|nr:hypothetical protein [Planctomycetota bacterium]